MFHWVHCMYVHFCVNKCIASKTKQSFVSMVFSITITDTRGPCSAQRGLFARRWMTTSVSLLKEDNDYSSCHIFHIPDGTNEKSLSFWVSWCSHLDSSVSQFITWTLFSATHWMLALVFSIACSRAMMPEPKPTWRLSSLNCFSWRKQRKTNSISAYVAFLLLWTSWRKCCVYFSVVEAAWASYLLQLKLCRESRCNSVDETKERKWSLSIPNREMKDAVDLTSR